jgi:hypothetical protein
MKRTASEAEHSKVVILINLDRIVKVLQGFVLLFGLKLY